MSAPDPLAEAARRLTVETYRAVSLAQALRRKIEDLEKETWKYADKLEKSHRARSEGLQGRGT